MVLRTEINNTKTKLRFFLSLSFAQRNSKKSATRWTSLTFLICHISLRIVDRLNRLHSRHLILPVDLDNSNSDSKSKFSWWSCWMIQNVNYIFEGIWAVRRTMQADEIMAHIWCVSHGVLLLTRLAFTSRIKWLMETAVNCRHHVQMRQPSAFKLMDCNLEDILPIVFGCIRDAKPGSGRLMKENEVKGRAFAMTPLNWKSLYTHRRDWGHRQRQSNKKNLKFLQLIKSNMHTYNFH